MKFIPQYQPEVRLRYIYDVAKQMYSGWVGTGKATDLFEDKIKEITGAKYAVSTTSGTTALILAIESLNLKKGSTILFPSYTFLAGANAARFMGYNIRLVDIKEDTLCMNPDLIKVTEDVSCIMFVNHNGYVGVDAMIIRSICDKHSIPMIEDSSQCIGIPTAGRTGDVGVFSFSVPKLVTTGQGGVLFTNREDISIKARQVRDHGDNWRQSKLHDYMGVNFKFNDILAAYGLSQLNILNDLVSKRGNILKEYDGYIDLWLNGFPDIYRSTWMATYRTKHAKEIMFYLKDMNIQATQYYKPVSWNKPYETNEKFPVTEKVYNELLYLPSSLNLKNYQIEMICDCILEVEE